MSAPLLCYTTENVYTMYTHMSGTLTLIISFPAVDRYRKVDEHRILFLNAVISHGMPAMSGRACRTVQIFAPLTRHNGRRSWIKRRSATAPCEVRPA